MISASTINDIVTFIYGSGEYNKIISNLIYKSGYSYADIEDVKQEIYLQILYGPDKLIDIYNRGEFKFWFVRMAFNQICSTKSSMYSKLLKKDLLNDEYEEQIHFTEISENYELDIDDKDMFNLLISIAGENIRTNANQKRNYELFVMYYIEDMTMQAISDKTSIPVSNVYKYLRFTRDYLKKRIDKNLFNDYGDNYNNN